MVEKISRKTHGNIHSVTLNFYFASIVNGDFMPEMNFEGTATWKGGTECQLSIKGKELITVSPPPMFGGKDQSDSLGVKQSP